jgi:hypothetical protein
MLVHAELVVVAKDCSTRVLSLRQAFSFFIEEDLIETFHWAL